MTSVHIYRSNHVTNTQIIYICPAITLTTQLAPTYGNPSAMSTRAKETTSALRRTSRQWTNLEKIISYSPHVVANGKLWLNLELEPMESYQRRLGRLSHVDACTQRHAILAYHCFFMKSQRHTRLSHSRLIMWRDSCVCYCKRLHTIQCDAKVVVLQVAETGMTVWNGLNLELVEQWNFPKTCLQYKFGLLILLSV